MSLLLLLVLFCVLLSFSGSSCQITVVIVVVVLVLQLAFRQRQAYCSLLALLFVVAFVEPGTAVRFMAPSTRCNMSICRSSTIWLDTKWNEIQGPSRRMHVALARQSTKTAEEGTTAQRSCKKDGLGLQGCEIPAVKKLTWLTFQ